MQTQDNDLPLLTRNQFTSGQYHVIEVMAKTLDQTITEYLREILLETVGNYVQSDMIDDILERELGLKEDKDGVK